ncbi:MAG: hypothetical protein HKN47_14405 [Pirellulaceae bacterium]|nr:hypothetical protein [Pirellulaceae bacterium]
MPQMQPSALEKLQVFSTELLDAIDQAVQPGLADGPVNESVMAILNSGDMERHLGSEVGPISGPIAQCCISGLWLLAGDIDRSHAISQNLSSAEGSFLHGIMHRREQDFGNAKYWFRKVGEHSVFFEIAANAGEIYTDPFDFVDACSDAVRNGVDKERCQDAQWIEWQYLMAHIVAG